MVSFHQHSSAQYFLRIISPHREQSIYCDFRSSFSATWIQSSTEVIFWIFITDISCLLFHLLQTLPFRVNEYLCGEMISHSCQRIQQWRIVCQQQGLANRTVLLLPDSYAKRSVLNSLPALHVRKLIRRAPTRKYCDVLRQECPPSRIW